MVEPYSHQETALNLLRLNDGFALFMEQGTGKSFPVLFRLAELAERGLIRSALVVDPKAVCELVAQKVGLLSDAQRAALESVGMEVASYDIVWRRERYGDGTFDAVVLDESHYVKSPSAKRSHACIALCSGPATATSSRARRRRTGSCATFGPVRRYIDPVVVRGRVYPGCLGGDSYYKSIDRVAYLNQWHQPYKYRNVDELQGVIAEHSYHIAKAECLELPENS